MPYDMFRRMQHLCAQAPALLPAFVLAAGAVLADLKRFVTVVARQSGHVLDHGYVRAVFHPPYGLLWILRPDGWEGDQTASKPSDLPMTLRAEKTANGLRIPVLDFLNGDTGT